MEKKSYLSLLICFSASLFFFYEFIQGNMFASIADSIMSDFHIQADKMTYLSSVYYIANVLFLVVAGRLLDLYSPKKIIMIAMSLCVFSTFILAHTHSLLVALLARFSTGIGSAFCFLGPIRIASRWYPPRCMAMITGIIVTFAMTGGMMAQYPLTLLVVHLGWRMAVTLVAWLGLFMLIVMYFGIIEKPHELKATQQVAFWSVLRQVYSNSQNIIAAFYTSLMNMAIAVFGAMMGVLYLEQRLTISKESASAINMLLFLGAIVGGPLMGFISDRLRNRILPMRIGAFLSFVTILLVMYAPLSIVLMKICFFLLGLFTASQVISYALVAESAPLALTATSVGVISLLTQGGYVIYQNIFSFLLMHYGQLSMEQGTPIYPLASYQRAGLILPIGFLVAMSVLLGLRETHARRIGGNG